MLLNQNLTHPLEMAQMGGRLTGGGHVRGGDRY